MTAAVLALIAILAGTRLDASLVARGLCSSRAAAKAAIQAGLVTVDGAVITKVAHACDEAAEVAVIGSASRYVSRAGDKLRAALEAFHLDVHGADVLDVGASTGGFTHCLLDAGAASAVCVDCGHDQLHATIAADARVTSLEGINARHLTAAQLPRASYEAIVVDVSFISLLLVLPALWPLLEAESPRARLLALVKPQFEAGLQLGEEGRRALNKGKGVLTDDALQLRVLEGVAEFAIRELSGCAVLGTIDSPLAGGDGNREFLICLGHAVHAPSERGPFVEAAKARLQGRRALSNGDGASAPGASADEMLDGLQAVDVRRRGQTAASRAEAHAKRKRKGDPLT